MFFKKKMQSPQSKLGLIKYIRVSRRQLSRNGESYTKDYDDVL
jgi:hypothetical protein